MNPLLADIYSEIDKDLRNAEKAHWFVLVAILIYFLGPVFITVIGFLREKKKHPKLKIIAIKLTDNQPSTKNQQP